VWVLLWRKTLLKIDEIDEAIFWLQFHHFFQFSTSHISKAKAARKLLFGGLVVLLWST